MRAKNHTINILHVYHVNVCVHVYEPQSEKMYLSPKFKNKFQKSDHTSLNCHLAKFDSNVMTVSGENIPICTKVSFTVNQSFSYP